MISRNTLFVWIGIVVLSGMFLAGQESWAPEECADGDGDGYGNPATGCTHLQLDCDDGDAGVNPGALEGPDGNPVCGDLKDNDCDGLTDAVDLGCVACVDGDGDGFGLNASENCVHPYDDCNDTLPAVNPGASEGPQGDPTCSDSLDNDCDGLADGADPRCSAQSMIDLPAGCFDMGDSFNEGTADEEPVHNVCLSAYAIDATEVTNADYIQCVLANHCSSPSASSSTRRDWYYGNPEYSGYPVIWVTWQQADIYCNWLGKRLPTEAEWEYAARGGLAGNRYPWGDTLDCSDADYGRWLASDACWNYNGLENDTQAVASYPANGLGLHEMAGNNFEWVNDYYSATYYQTSPVYDPQGPATGTSRVYRGGSFVNVPTALRVADRNSRNPASGNFNIGFRCAE